MKVSQSEPAPPQTTHPNITESRGFPYFQYISVLGILTTLLGFSGIYLPRSTTYFATLPPPQSSLDKPQHPLLVPITASPVLTLFWLCLGIATCQAWFGGWVRSWWSRYPRLGFQSSKANDIDTLISQSKSSQVFLTAIANTIAGSLLIHALAVGLGAPIFSYFLRTYFLALLIALLVVFVPSYALSLPLFSKVNDDSKLSWVVIMRLFGQRRLTTPLERSIVYPCYFVFAGSWLGTIPIALDWDRPWQAWPLTPAYGALIGYILGLWVVLGVNIFLRLVEEGTTQHKEIEKDK